MSPPPIKIRGIRTPIPAGYVLGRTSQGKGDTQLIAIADLGKALVAVGGGGGGGGVAGTGSIPPVSKKASTVEYLGFQAVGPFTAIQQFILAMAPRAVTFPSVSLVDLSSATCTSAPHANTSLVLTDNLGNYLAHGTNIVCTVSFAAGAKTGTLVWGTPTLEAIGTVLYIAMITADASFAGVQCLFAGDAQ
jgi:hypothetical protein